MEALGATLRKASSTAGRSEEDQIYEDIEAPKFVDFTVPDSSRPDDRSWFCARIGCDQNHEELDPDALYKSFFLRVMAARSPNLRLQKALRRQQPPSPIAKCPLSAPAKSVKARMNKLAVLRSISEKIAVPSKLKVHPISTLRSTPNRAKTKRQPTAEKAMTTPRNKMRAANEEPFRSAQSSKVRGPPVPKNRAVVKALTFQTPQRVEDAPASIRRTPVAEATCGMNTIKVAGDLGGASSISGSKPRGRKPLCKVRETPLNAGACSAVDDRKEEREGGSAWEEGREGVEVVEVPSSSANSEDQKGSSFLSKPREEDPREKPLDSDACSGLADEKHEKRVTENYLDENKENALQTHDTNRNMNLDRTNEEAENCQNKNGNIPRKAIVVKSRYLLETKFKVLKPTHPRPFRLRTDERGILRETNLEKAKPQNGDPVSKTLMRAKLVEESEGILCTRRAKAPLDSGEKLAEKVSNKTRSAALQQLLKPQRATAPEHASMPHVSGKERACSKAGKDTASITTMSPQLYKRAVTIAKEPTFHKINVPRSCTKRLEKARQ